MRRALVVCFALVACDQPTEKPVAPATSPAPAPKKHVAKPAPVFVDVAAESGITAMNHTGAPGAKPWMAADMGGGVIVLDYDQDGRMDLVVVDGTMLTEDGKLEFSDEARTRVYHNDGGMKFHETTKETHVDLQAFGIGGASCDYDGDGWPDFYVCCWGKNRLFHNRGDGTFEEVAEKAGVAGGADDFSTGCCFGDVNGDGIVDLYVANYADQRKLIDEFRANGLAARQTKWRGITVATGPIGLLNQQDRLYFGNGDGTFRDVTETNLGKEPAEGYGFQPVMTDVDDDGDLDVYVANDLGGNFLWVNDGHGKFKESALEAGVQIEAGGRRQASMGLDVADVNRDGRLDLFVTNFSHDHNTLYVNQSVGGRAAFADLSIEYGVAVPSRNRVSWGTKLWDYDNDGELDLFCACGHVYPEIDGYPALGATYKERCLLLRNVGPPTRAFLDVSDHAGAPFQVERCWRGAAFADFDNDGDLDVLVTALNDKPALLRNDGGNANEWLAFRLVGKKPRDPCGARVTVFLEDGKPRVEELHHGVSFCGDNDPRLFFGLADETAAKRVEVRWPNGKKGSFENVAARKSYVIDETSGSLREETNPRDREAGAAPPHPR